MKKRAKESARERTLSDAELRVLWRALENPNGTSEDIALALRVVLLTGQRPGEVAGALQHELIYLETPVARWEIPAARTKARRPHVVPLAPMARELFVKAVGRRRGEGDKTGVFASRFFSRETLARHSLSRALARVIGGLEPEGSDADVTQSIKANPPTPHDFRRTVATGLAALGVAREDRLAVLAHVAGDIHGVVYDKYERLKEKQVALAKWEQHLSGVLGGTQ
jgi:integrase